MARKRGGSDEGGGDSWLNTYADMVTLLLTFFAVLLSMSSVDQEKFNAFVKSLAQIAPEKIEEILDAPPGPSDDEPGSDAEENANAMDKLYENLKDYIDKNNKGEGLEIGKVDDVVYIRFSSAVFFKPDKYELREEAMDTLDFIGDGLKSYEDEIKLINICGHTADPPNLQNLPTFEWLLSGERAGVVAQNFEQVKGIDPKKIITFGYGDNFPVADNTTEEGRMKNRRVELVIIGINSDVNFNAYELLNDLYNDKEYPTSGGTNDILFPPSIK